MSCCNGKLDAGKVIRGAVGLTKAFLGVGLADDVTIASRRDICRSCEHSEKKQTPEGVKVRKCNLCLCFIGPKTKLKAEKCPADKW